VATTTLGCLPTVVVLRVGTVAVGMVVAEEETVAVVADKAVTNDPALLPLFTEVHRKWRSQKPISSILHSPGLQA
jgi:hypothetical protein